jgi:hypothetical protein
MELYSKLKEWRERRIKELYELDEIQLLEGHKAELKRLKREKLRREEYKQKKRAIEKFKSNLDKAKQKWQLLSDQIEEQERREDLRHREVWTDFCIFLSNETAAQT